MDRGLPIGAGSGKPLAGCAVIGIMTVTGMGVVYSAMYLPPLRIEMDLFLWVLEAGGVSIALIGWQRERWLQQRRR